MATSSAEKDEYDPVLINDGDVPAGRSGIFNPKQNCTGAGKFPGYSHNIRRPSQTILKYSFDNTQIPKIPPYSTLVNVNLPLPMF